MFHSSNTNKYVINNQFIIQQYDSTETLVPTDPSGFTFILLLIAESDSPATTHRLITIKFNTQEHNIALPTRGSPVMLLLCLLALLFLLYSAWTSHPPRQRHRYRIKTSPCPAARNQRKPAWVKEAIIRLKAESNLSCYKLAATFNQLYAAEQGVTVGKTFVAETVRAHAYEIG